MYALSMYNTLCKGFLLGSRGLWRQMMAIGRCCQGQDVVGCGWGGAQFHSSPASHASPASSTSLYLSRLYLYLSSLLTPHHLHLTSLRLSKASVSHRLSHLVHLLSLSGLFF